MTEGRRTTTILLIAVCLVYIAVRIWRLTDSCLWFDEIFSVHAAEHDWSSLFWFVARDLIHPPLFYVLLKLWIGVGGESVFWLRLLPVLFSVLTLIPFFRLGRELNLERPIIIAGMFLLAVNGALIKYTQTLRMYSMLMFLAVLSMWLFARYFNRGKSFVPLLITNLFLVYTHYYGWLVVGTEVATILILQRIKWRRAAVMTGSLAISFVPWMWFVLRAMSDGSDVVQNIAWQPRPGIRELAAFFVDLVEPVYFQASSAEPPSMYAISIPILLISFAALTIYFAWWRNREEKKEGIWLLVLFVSLPFVLTFISSWMLPHSVWGTRHLIVIFPPAMLLMAAAVCKIGNEIARTVLVTCLLFFFVAAVFIVASRQPPRHVWCAWNDVAANIRALETSGDQPVKIYTFENLVAYHIWFALRDSDRFDISVVKGVDVRTDDETYFLPRGFYDVARANVAEINDERLWLAFRSSVPGDEAPLIETYQRLGYRVCQLYREGYGRTTVFWIEMRRALKECGPQNPQLPSP